MKFKGMAQLAWRINAHNWSLRKWRQWIHQIWKEEITFEEDIQELKADARGEDPYE
jgi:hypothetical protein